MMRHSHLKLLLLAIPVILSACDKADEPVPPTPGPEVRVLDTALVFSVDSCCVMIPNIFTPNGDGYNDMLWLGGPNIDTFSIDIRNASGTSLFVNSDPLIYWDGQDLAGSITTGFYTYTFYCRSISGVELTKTNKIFLCKVPGTDCFSAAVPPQTNDMIDFSQCGFTFATGEIFCYQL